MMSERIRNHNNYIPIEQPTFQSVAAHQPLAARIFGPGRTEDYNSWSKLIAIILICA
jgi:hypothetical protein